MEKPEKQSDILHIVEASESKTDQHLNNSFFLGPSSADLNLTNACNLACSHCHASSGKAIKGELSTIEVMDAIFQLYEMGVRSLTIAGGEPFIRRDIFDILSFANNIQGLETVAITNGVNIDDHFIEKLQPLKNIRINISVDGSNHEVFNVYRRIKNDTTNNNILFNKVLDNLRKCVNSGITTGVSFVLSKHNMHDLRNAYDLMVNQIGVTSFAAIKFLPTGYGKKLFRSMEFDYPTWRDLILSLHKEKQNGGISRLLITTPSLWEVFLPLTEAGIDQKEIKALWHLSPALNIPGFREHHKLGDPSGTMSVCVDSNGDVYPSVLAIGSNHYCGNIKTSPLKHTWNESSTPSGTKW